MVVMSSGIICISKMLFYLLLLALFDFCGLVTKPHKRQVLAAFFYMYRIYWGSRLYLRFDLFTSAFYDSFSASVTKYRQLVLA